MQIHPAKHSRLALLSALLLVVLSFAVPGAAQDVRLLSTKVADILAQFPAGGPADRDKLADQVLGLGEEGVGEFTRRLVPAGAGNDTAVRFALNGVAVYASKAGEPKRALAERAFVAALGSTSDVEVRTFLLSQLRVVGRDAAVKAAAPLLADQQLVEPATQLLLTIKSVAARKAAVAALRTAQGAGRITIVKAIGELNAKEANGRLLPFANDPNPGMRRAALASLARIASPASYAALTVAARRADYRYEPSNAVGALLEYAQRLGQLKRTRKTAEKVCRLVMTKTDDQERRATRAAALAVLVDVAGRSALPDLLKAVDHPDREYRNAALLKAERMGGAAAVPRWVAKAKSVNAERRAEIIAMLGREGNRAALPFIRASMSAMEPAVALAAAESLAHMEHGRAVPALLARLKTANPETAAPLAALLNWTIDEKGLDPLVAMMDRLQPAAKAAAIGVIGSKNGKRFADRIIPLTSDPNPEIRAAAFRALPGVVGARHLAALLPLLDHAPEAQKTSSAPNEAEGGVSDVQKAVVAAASQVSPEDARAVPVLQAMKTATHPERFVAVLPEVGGTAALAALVEQFNGANPALKTAAFRGLVQWRGPEAADRLLAIAQGGDPAYRDQAFAGFVRQVSSSSLPDAQKVAQLKKALPLATTARDRRTLLRGFERAKTLESLGVAASFMDDGEVAADAAGAVMRIALPNPGAKDGLRGPEARRALEKVLQVLTGPESDYDKENVRTYLKTLPGEGGAAPSMSDEERAQGFVPLFNGRNLDGWMGNLTGYKVEDGLMVFDPKASDRSNIYTEKEYSDFQFRFEFQLSPAANSGVGIRAPKGGDAAYVGMEIQVLDDTAPVYAALQPYQYHGSVYGVIAARRGALKPVGEWNSEEIRVQGSHITVTVNGTVTVDGDLVEASRNGTVDHKEHPGLQRASGYIGFLSHDSVVKFRNIRLKDLSR